MEEEEKLEESTLELEESFKIEEKFEQEDEHQPPAESERRPSTVLRVCFELVEHLQPEAPELITTYPRQSYCDCSCQCVT